MGFDLNEEITKEKEFSRICDKDVSRVKSFISKIKKIKGAGVIEYEITAKDSKKYIERHCSYDCTREIYTGVILDITEKVLERKEKKQRELALLNQSKLASLGEMIGNIAHQWRQPLSIITVASSGIKLQNEAKILNDEILYKELDLINDNCFFLSNTIETFRNYIETSKELKEIVLQETIKTTLEILDASLKNSYIKLVHNLDESLPIKLKLVPSEIGQVIMNIITNAKDILLEKKINNALIILTLEKDDKNIKISIKDNAGGVPSSISSKIFDPYFTTKYKSQGTGLGLYMSYQIISQQLNGNIDTNNIKFIHDNIEYFGAEFVINIPIIQK